MRAPRRIVLGTRGSELARAQTRLVENALRAAFPELELAVKIITTRGDEGRSSSKETLDPAAGRKGVFTGEIEQALRREEIDVAVHSAKDLPSDASDDLEICAALPRAAFDDALIFKKEANFESLPRNAIVATGSIRRQYQLSWKRPDLRFADLRGNVPTRLRKLIDGEWDAIVLARAGLDRLGYGLADDAFTFESRSLSFELLPAHEFPPAGGQGIVALQTRTDDGVAKDHICSINDATTLLALHAEREFLHLLQADCNSPVGVLATIESETMTLRAQVFEPPATKPKVGIVQSSLRTDGPIKVAAALHSLMYGQR